MNGETCGHYHNFSARATVIHETLTSIKRAGADIILTYHAKEFLERGLDER